MPETKWLSSKPQLSDCTVTVSGFLFLCLPHSNPHKTSQNRWLYYIVWSKASSSNLVDTRNLANHQSALAGSVSQNPLSFIFTRCVKPNAWMMPCSHNATHLQPWIIEREDLLCRENTSQIISNEICECLNEGCSIKTTRAKANPLYFWILFQRSSDLSL